MQQTANGMSRDVVVYCHTGMRSYMAACLLEQHGLKQVSNLAGGWELYAKLQLPSAL
jgi:rhodanese-related sulfurtransferase